MKRSIKIILGSIVGVGLVGAVTAKQFGHCDYGAGSGYGHFSTSHEGRADWVTKRITGALDLNTAQQAELDKLKSSVFDGMQTMRTEKPQASEIQALLNNEFDQTKAMQLLEQRGNTIKENAPILVAAFADFYNQLDAEQQAKISEMVEHRMGQHDRGHGKGFFHE